MKTRFAFWGALLSSLFASAAYAEYRELGYDNRPSYIPNNVIVLTFDDGPDYGNTANVLNVLRDKGAHATFFINTVNYSNVDQEPPMQDLVRRIVNEGHTLGNHTVHHEHLGDLSAGDIENEIAGVENTVRNVFNGGGPALTLLRAPFGEPFQSEDPNSEVYQRVAGVVQRHAVQVGWNVDPGDYNCPEGDSNCVYNNVVNLVRTPGQGQYGIILMHSVNSQTPAALGRLIDYFRGNGFQLWSVEDVVRARYGSSSYDLIHSGGNPGGPSGNGLQVGASYSLVSRYSGKCLDVTDVSYDSGAWMQQWDCAGSANQGFRLLDAGNGTYFLQALHSGKCVDVESSNNFDGAKIQQWDCNGTNAQRVSIAPTSDGYYSVLFANGGRALDVSGPSYDNGAQVHLWQYYGLDNQQWRFDRR